MVYFFVKLTSMASDYSGKLNRILHEWPNGTVAVLDWLKMLGGYQQLLQAYQKSFWVEKIGRGAYKKYGDAVDWTGGLYALQTQLNLPVYAGAKTALEMMGYGHFIPLGKGRQITLLAYKDVKLPAWFKDYDWDDTVLFKMLTLFPENPTLGLTERRFNTYRIRISAPERAMFEVCALVQRSQSFGEAKYLMEGLMGLRTDLLQELLVQCTSVKAKRLFLYFADICNMPWFSRLDLSKVDLGKGKRQIVKGGVYDSKYRITVARDFDNVRLEDIP